MRYLTFFQLASHFNISIPILILANFVHVNTIVHKLKETGSKFGTIFKREALASVSLNLDTEVLILKSKDPFPGYYCSADEPANNACKEQSFYLPVYSASLEREDQLCRLCLQSKSEFRIQTCPAQFSLNGKSVRGIRLKDVDQSQFNKVILFFQEAGLEFHTNKKVSTYLSQIYLKAFFEVHQYAAQVYQNSDYPDLYYLEIDEKLEWSVFERLITYQKSQTNFKNYDAAMGYWYTQPSFTDFIRVYGKDLSAEVLISIRKEYLKNYKAFKESRILF